MKIKTCYAAVMGVCQLLFEQLQDGLNSIYQLLTSLEGKEFPWLKF
jgi:hypothetical protein